MNQITCLKTVTIREHRINSAWNVTFSYFSYDIPYWLLLQILLSASFLQIDLPPPPGKNQKPKYNPKNKNTGLSNTFT